jgi:hypothetical protein
LHENVSDHVLAACFSAGSRLILGRRLQRPAAQLDRTLPLTVEL